MATITDLFAHADLNLISEEPFTDEKFKELKTLSVPQVATDNDLQSLATLLRNHLTTWVLTENTPKMALVLAIYVEGRDKATPPLLKHRPEGGDDIVLANLIGEAPNPDYIPVQGEELVARKMGEDETAYQIRALAARAMGVQNARQPPAAGTVSPRYVKFLSAYYLRLFVKSPQNMMLSKTRMDATYAKMYSEDAETALNISEATWDKFKTMITGMPKLINTWVRCVSTFESIEDQDSENAGMIRYLANLPLSFAGMHAYSLFLEVMRKTGKYMRWLLTEMCTSPTKDSLVQIMNIARSFEKKAGTAERSTTYYRYACVVSPKFFTKVQTKNALSLVYLETKILSHYVTFGESGPDKIVALAPLGQAQREFLDVHAREIIHKITTEGDAFASESAKAARAKIMNPETTVDNQQQMLLDQIRNRINPRVKYDVGSCV